MNNRLTQIQIGGFIFAFLLITFGFVSLMLNNDSDAWGWFLGTGVISFFITLFPKDKMM